MVIVRSLTKFGHLNATSSVWVSARRVALTPRKGRATEKELHSTSALGIRRVSGTVQFVDALVQATRLPVFGPIGSRSSVTPAAPEKRR